MKQKSLFIRPKANVLVTVVTSERNKPFDVKNVAKYPVKSVSWKSYKTAEKSRKRGSQF